ncbi:MAG TPA: WGxxGxxG family protein [Methylophilaceae bacterium]|nr:WGxxGxxG family protein [Methylophilaceae bacterium]
MTDLKTKNPLAIGLLVIALNTAMPNLAFAGGTTGDAGTTAGDTTTAGDVDMDPGMGDGVDEENDWGWIGLLGLLGLLGLKRRDNTDTVRTTR